MSPLYLCTRNSISFLLSKTCLKHTFPFSEEHQSRPAARALYHGLKTKLEENVSEIFRRYFGEHQRGGEKRMCPRKKSKDASPYFLVKMSNISFLRWRSSSFYRWLLSRSGSQPLIFSTNITRAQHYMIYRLEIIRFRLGAQRLAYHIGWASRLEYQMATKPINNTTMRIKAIGKTVCGRHTSSRLSLSNRPTLSPESPTFFLFDICDRRIIRGRLCCAGC